LSRIEAEINEIKAKTKHLKKDSEFSLFEVNIRFVGGLLAAHSLTNEKIFLDKAKEIADLLMPAFKSETGIPYSLVNPIS
jgi:mannosyl-oligosaccharide alpha-1,2-mannosidase